MAEYRTPPGVDPIEFLGNKVANLEARLIAQEGRTLHSTDRHDHDSIVAPVEGQTIIQHDTNQFCWYSDGSWYCTSAPVRFRARRKTTFQTLGAGGAETDLEWNYWENGSSAVWQAQTAAGAVETVTTNPIRSVVLLVPAIVTMSGCISVETLASGQLAIVINDGYDNPEIVVHPAQVAGSGGDYVFTHHRSYPVLDASDDPEGSAEFSIDAAQNSGVGRDTRFGTYWELTAWPV